MSDKKQLQEDFLKKFAQYAASFAAGAGVAKISNMLKDKKKSKAAWDEYIKDQERLEKKFEKKLKSLPDEEKERLLKLQNKILGR